MNLHMRMVQDRGGGLDTADKEEAYLPLQKRGTTLSGDVILYILTHCIKYNHTYCTILYCAVMYCTVLGSLVCEIPNFLYERIQ